MPIVEPDPWRKSFFAHVPCPDAIRIPTKDTDAYLWNPENRWVYNKLLICETQGIEAAPHGIVPTRFPVFSKPIYNLRSMGPGSRVVRCAEEYAQHQQPGYLWCTLLEGEHLSTDAAIVAGETAWWRHSKGFPLPGGTFDHWTVEAAPRPDLERYCGEWVRRHLTGYTGMANLETIGGRIIEVHLRFADQWPDLYGAEWVESLVRLYAGGRWEFSGSPREGYSVVLFGEHGVRHRYPDPEAVEELRASPEISSVQLSFYEDKPPEWHSMPPGGFRLAIVNCWNLEAGFRVRDRLSPYIARQN